MALTLFNPAPLPNPPAMWDPQYMRQVIRVLELYFNQLESGTPNYADSYTAKYFYGSGVYLTTPYGSFTSITNQNSISAPSAYAVTFDNQTFGRDITLSSGSHINIAISGVYLFTYSLQTTNTDNDTNVIEVWLRKNGVDIVNSARRFSMPPRKAVGSTSSSVLAEGNIIGRLEAGDYVQVMWHTPNTLVYLAYTPALVGTGLAPAIPANPSAFAQITFLSDT